MKKALFLLVTLFHLNLFATVIVDEAIFVFDHDGSALQMTKNFPELTVDHLSSEGFELYGPAGVISWAQTMKLDFAVINKAEGTPNYKLNNSSDDPYTTYFSTSDYHDQYPTNEENYNTLKALELRYPEILKLFSLGKSIEGQEIWAMKISDNVEQDEVEPEFKYIANMHGDEITGREMLMRLIEDLAEGYYRLEPRFLKLIENTEIFIIPTMNPDGNANHRRGNSARADLNRDFPDFITDPTNTLLNRQPETAAIMKFQAAHKFALSANLHDGISVVNYPWDSTLAKFPLDDLVRQFSLEYVQDIEDMYSKQFPQGITNGAAWYVIHGGMQDWSYYWYGDLQLTIEVSKQKWPPFYQIDYFYAEHKEPLISYIERIHQGAGFKFKRQGVSGEVSIKKVDLISGVPQNYGTYGFDSSEFYKVLDKGLYQFQVTTQNGQTFTFLRLVSELPGPANGNYKKLKMTL